MEETSKITEADKMTEDTKSNAGRKVKYETPDQLQILIDDYFTASKELKQHPTITGLAYHLDLTREGLAHYSKKNEFTDTIKRAKQRVEAYIEQRLFEANATGSIFNLKNNFGWKDKTETELSTPEGRPLEINNMSEQDVKARINELLIKRGGIGTTPAIGEGSSSGGESQS